MCLWTMEEPLILRFSSSVMISVVWQFPPPFSQVTLRWPSTFAE